MKDVQSDSIWIIILKPVELLWICNCTLKSFVDIIALYMDI
jgi:hypothetical protein